MESLLGRTRLRGGSSETGGGGASSFSTMGSSTDGGKTWIHSELIPKQPLMQIRFFGRNGWIVGGSDDESVVIRSSDGGETWERQPNVAAGRVLIFSS